MFPRSRLGLRSPSEAANSENPKACTVLGFSCIVNWHARGLVAEPGGFCRPGAGRRNDEYTGELLVDGLAVRFLLATNDILPHELRSQTPLAADFVFLDGASGFRTLSF